MRSGYTRRTPRDADRAGIVELLYAAESELDPSATRYTVDEISNDWAELDLARDAWLVATGDDVICAYGTVSPVAATGRIFADAYTHPQHVGAGLGTALVERMEVRAAEIAAAAPADIRQVLVNYVPLGGAAETLLRQRGYALRRVHQRMRVDLDRPPVPPSWPAGVQVRTCRGDADDIARAHRCVEDAFVDHWGRARRTLDQWTAHMVYDGFDPSLWLLAERAGTVVGASLCRLRDGVGEVDQLGVLREARRQGLGEALLVGSFAEFARRGVTRVALGVDSDSLTGAHRLYERVGMTVVSGMGRFERELRPGRDLLDEVLAAQHARVD